mmetsp:Transcript_34763/g.71014  ORF Transcript_34763/g.71014 Transcript_34763/m.71014 type:complete len:206 (-) Transcript_34763:877-1494(-)
MEPPHNPRNTGNFQTQVPFVFRINLTIPDIKPPFPYAPIRLPSRHGNPRRRRRPRRDPPQPRYHVRAHQPPVRRREHVTVHPVHDASVFRDQIAEVLDSRVPLQHGRRQIPHESQKGEVHAVDRSGQVPERPSHDPGSRGGQDGRNETPPQETLHGLVGTRDARGRSDATQFRFAEGPTEEVPPHVRKRYAKPRPEYENRPLRDG